MHRTTTQRSTVCCDIDKFMLQYGRVITTEDADRLEQIQSKIIAHLRRNVTENKYGQHYENCVWAKYEDYEQLLAHDDPNKCACNVNEIEIEKGIALNIMDYYRRSP